MVMMDFFLSSPPLCQGLSLPLARLVTPDQ
jgi:hypothetical protein